MRGPRHHVPIEQGSIFVNMVLPKTASPEFLGGVRLLEHRTSTLIFGQGL